MKRILLVSLMLFWTSAGYAVLGDLNRDGVVDFDDFFLFADNFGKEGVPEPLEVLIVRDTLTVVRTDTITDIIRDTVTVVSLDTIFEVIRDTVVIVRTDTVFLGLPEIPTAPPIGQQTGIGVVEGSLSIDDVFVTNLYGEVANNSGTTAERVEIRFTLRDVDGKIIAVEGDQFEPIIWILAPGDRRPFKFFDVTGLTDLSDLERATFDITWNSESSKQLNNDLVLVQETLNIGSSIAGEIRNVGTEEARDIRITLIERNSVGQVMDFESREVNFGDPLSAGSTGVFESFLTDTGGAEIYYYISWGPWGDKKGTPYTRLSVE